MPGSNPSITTTRLAANYGFEHLRQLSADNQRHQDTTGFTGVTQSRNIGKKHVSKTRILQFQPNSVLRIKSTLTFLLLFNSAQS